MTGGGDFAATVYPFILRGVNLLGIDTVEYPIVKRKRLWERMATDLKPASLLTHISNEITLDELPVILPKILKGEIRGRTVVKL